MSASPILPVYHRSLSTGVFTLLINRSCRYKEKHLIVIVLTFIILGSFGTMFFMPDSREGQVYKVYDKLKRSGPELLFPPPPRLHDKIIKHADPDHLDPHLLEDRIKLKAKIELDTNVIIERPPDIIKTTIKRTTRDSVHVQKNQSVNLGNQMLNDNNVPIQTDVYPLTSGGEDKSPKARERRNKVRQMMKHAWDGYVNYAWGANELRPISKTAHFGSIFGSSQLGATIIDSMDTLYIMGFHDEFNKGRDWIANNFNVDNISASVSVFEVNIRFIGGLLTCYALTGDVMFRDKAKQIADKLLPAFNTQTGIPLALVNFKTGRSQSYGWASGSSLLSEYGSLYLEFFYLSEVTGDPIYKEKVERIMDFLYNVEKPNGLYPNYINPHTGKWGSNHVSMGSLGDSFYEYLLKIYLQSNKTNTKARSMFEDTIKVMLEKMIFTSPGGLQHFSELKNGKPEHKMEHLACFSGGLLGLASHTLQNNMSRKYMSIAQEITFTCRESYDRSKVKLGPESFRFTDQLEAESERASEKIYILRPEVLESYFYMYRLTKEEKYRNWGWDMVEALEKYCKVPSGGYTGLRNVYSVDTEKDDVMQSFFLAETLKYLYLLFSDESLLSLDKWVLNTEAHPLPIKYVNPYYRLNGT